MLHKLWEYTCSQIRNVVDDDAADIYVKLEYQNPGGSVKDRIALAMIEKLSVKGKLNLVIQSLSLRVVTLV